MNYLALCQRLRLECGISGTGPTTVVGQVGELSRLVTWTNAAWIDIQTAHQDWSWMRNSASFTTLDGQAVYELGTAAGTTGVSVATFGRWIRNSARSYVTATGTNSESILDYMRYEDWRDAYQFGATRNTKSRPAEFTITPSKGLGLGPVPAVGYTITCDYFTAPLDMAADADVPALPAAFHLAIVYKAMMMYGAYEAAPEVYQRGEVEFGKLMSRLTADRLPEIGWAGALA